jgi:hypothetical protein
MNSSYLILNRTPSLIIKAFIFNTIILAVLIIWGINTLYYQKFIKLHSEIVCCDSLFYSAVLVPIKEVKQIINNNSVKIEGKTYLYSVNRIDNNITYINNKNYIKIYLEIFNLDKEYLINGYKLDLRILTENKKIIEYLKNEREDLIYEKN